MNKQNLICLFIFQIRDIPPLVSQVCHYIASIFLRQQKARFTVAHLLAYLTCVAAGVQTSGIQAGWVLCGSLQTWPEQSRRRAARRSLVDSRPRRSGDPPSPEGRKASGWCPGSAPQTHPLGRTWPETWTAVGSPSSRPGTTPGEELQHR